MTEVLDQEFLTPTEVKDLTGTAKPDPQAAELERQRIPYKRRGNRILVSRFHIRQWLAGNPVAPSRGVDLSLVK
jgi:hypothetical protein